MAYSPSLELDDGIPQWKKDLIMRKRGTGAVTDTNTNRRLLSSSSAGAEEQRGCDNDVKMVQDSVLVMRPPTNGFPGSDSDSSEELQYGPGIVSKLKSKYLSLTLREAHVAAPRPSILPLRRAASMEQLLDAEDVKEELPLKAPRRYTPRIPAAGAVTAPSPRYRAQMRRNGTETVKRARSVETVSRNLHTTLEAPEPGARKLNRPLRVAPIVDLNERPQIDHVKQTLRMFEGPACKRTKQPILTGDVAAKVASFKQIIINNAPPPAPPLPLSPKPINLPPKPTNIAAANFPKRSAKPKLEPKLDPKQNIPDVLDSSAGKCPTPDLIVHSSPQIVMRPFSPNTLVDVTESFLETERLSHVPQNLPQPKVQPLIDVSDVPRDVRNIPRDDIDRNVPKGATTILKDVTIKKDITVAKDVTTVAKDASRDASNALRDVARDTLRDVVKDASTDVARDASTDVARNASRDAVTVAVHVPKNAVHVPNNTVQVPKEIPRRSPSPRLPAQIPEHLKEISRQAVDNISKAGHTITYSDLSPKNQSHLPRLNSVPVRVKLVPEISSPPLKHFPPPAVVAKPPQVSQTSQNSQNSQTSQKVLNGRPSVQSQKTPLTSREIEKNSINKMKTLEQPVSKVVVAMRSVDEVLAKKVKSPRSPQQDTTILFNFSARESIPDYIASDGSQNVRRGKREKPKPGESGVILLPGAPAEEFADDDEDWMLSLNGPPSPCDVHFVNDNILIDGKSSISKIPKRQKLRIQFDDDATQVFEYLSEASAFEDGSSGTTPVTSPPPVAGHTVPSLSGSNFSNYTPLKMSTSDFQLGVTRQVVTSAPQASSPAPDSLDLLPLPAEVPVTYSAETTADILF